MRSFELPSKEKLTSMGKDERMNIFRQYFATSRYNRLLIQQALIRTALENSSSSRMGELEGLHDKDFFETTDRIRKFGFFDEFQVAVMEEDSALEKIIEAYNKRMDRSTTHL